jgi:D-alanyl-D-alanine carboxypeptidase
MNRNSSQGFDPIHNSKPLVAVFLVVAILLAASFAMLFALHNDATHPKKEKDDDSLPAGSFFDDDNDSEDQDDDNGTPIYVTTPSRNNYVSTRSSGVINLTNEIKSQNTILVDMDSYTSIVEKNADAKMYPASMTKVMTLLVICENATSLTKKLTVTEEMVKYKQENEGSGENFAAGEALTVKDFIYLVIYDSNTIACQILAEHIAGSESAFVAMMNAKAKELGLANTHFTNATGLYNENHYSTCREMAAIMAYALDNPLAKTVLTSFNGYSIKVYDSDTGKEVRSLLMYTDWYSVRFNDNAKLKTVTVKGGKTGFVDESGISLVSYAETPEGKGYINVIVGQPAKSENYVNASTSTSEVKYIYNNYVK